jgi:hypothetical protein
MLVFTLTLLPLFLVCCLFYLSKEQRAATFWAVLFGIASAVIAILAVTVLINNGFRAGWGSPLGIGLYFGITDFILPFTVAAFIWRFLLHKGQVSYQTRAPLIFFVTAMLLYSVQRILWYHTYYGFYELVFLPLGMFLLAYAAAGLFSCLKFWGAFIIVFILCLAMTVVAVFTMLSMPFFASASAVILLVILWLTGLVSHTAHERKLKKLRS